MSVSAHFVFFEAEDGIRDRVRSRGLGDVYKRQAAGVALPLRPPPSAPVRSVRTERLNWWHVQQAGVALRLVQLVAPVSYTHLTLPTSDLV